MWRKRERGARRDASIGGVAGWDRVSVDPLRDRHMLCRVAER
jgi:hypothetical protein